MTFFVFVISFGLKMWAKELSMHYLSKSECHGKRKIGELFKIKLVILYLQFNTIVCTSTLNSVLCSNSLEFLTDGIQDFLTLNS
jgi:hypothetical protein